MRKVKLLALLLALLMLLCSCGVNEADQMNREVVRVGNAAYTMADLTAMEKELRDYYDAMGQMYLMYYGFNPMSYTDEDIRTEAANNLATQAVMLDKAQSMGLDKITEEESAQAAAQANEAWQGYLTSYEANVTVAEDATAEEKRAAVEAALAADGITYATLLKTAREMVILDKLQAEIVKDVKTTEEEFVAAFNEKVAAEKAEYAEDLSGYGVAVLNGEAPYYTPAGYRYVKQILIQYKDEDTQLLSNIDNALYTAETTLSTAHADATALLGEDADLDALAAQVNVTLNEVTDPTVVTVKETTTAFTDPMGEDIAAAIKALAEARAIVAAYEEQQKLAVQNALANIAPEADEVLTRLEAGEDWDTLAAQFNDDPGMMAGQPTAETGYPVCEGFYYFDAAFVEAAMAIPAVGQWSDKTVGETYGYYIIQYTSDAVEGEVDKETVRTALTEELQTTKEQNVFSAALDQWIAAAQKRMLINYDLLWN